MTGYLNRKEAAGYVGCSLRKFETKVKPDLPVYKFGGTPMFRKEDIDAWAESRRVVTTPRAAVASTAFAGGTRRRAGAEKSASELRILKRLSD